MHPNEQSTADPILPVLLITQGGDFVRYDGFAVPLSGSRTETQGVVLCYQLRTVDLEAHGGKRVEAVPEMVMNDVLARIQVLIE